MKGPTSIRKDPACGTCRKKCRKCDRARPVCRRCVEKGLKCEGYPPKFKFFDSTPSDSEAALNPNGQSASSLQAGGSDLNAHVREAGPELPTPTQHVHDLHKDTEKNGIDSGATIEKGPPSADRPATPVESVLPGNEWLFAHFDEILVDILAIKVDGMENPYRQHVIPLAHRNGGVLHALLGLAACHMCTSHRITGINMMAIALHHRVAALHSLGCMLLQEEARGLDDCEEECVLAIVLLLVLHDVCEHGLSSRGAHLDGVAFLLARNAESTDLSHPSKASTLFFMATLAWLDVLRGFSGGTKLAYSDNVRACIKRHWSFGLYMTIGCPPDIFYCIGTVLEASKSFTTGSSLETVFRDTVREAERFLDSWDPSMAVYPTNNQDWKFLGTAFRHACLLRLMQWPESYSVPCEDARIKASVAAILDACAKVRPSSPCRKRLLFPLFIAAVDTSSPHQKDYVHMAIDQIKESTGFPHHAMTEVLGKVWKEREKNHHGGTNVPWMDFTCSDHLEGAQHAYLFF